ncbi:MAG: type VI secretion system membrane subunit TssM, partial [Gammaproteobacteria bacterium]|nr:type VI secretion system membrane subunit TssM [Gammaproteobacteria bacterium]
TTALINSGLDFPLAERFGKEALRGVGGTRDCDWWFTESAVLLDTAGRYTTQDSHAEVDSAGWSGFLDLLKKHRKRRPINGVLVALSVSDLLMLDDAERIAHVTAIKKRIQELYDHFGIRFPIYVLLTKSDLIAGFMEFFDDLGVEERKQAWGYTLPLIDAKGESFDLEEKIETEYDQLIERLNQRLVSRLASERDPQRRALIYGFPRQLASLREIVNGFLLSIFRPSRYETPPLLRGVYFTSGTQEGTPIDRVMGSLARTFGVDQQALPSFGGQGRSYFINKPLTEVAFVESELAGANVKMERRRALMQWGAYAGITAVTVLAIAGWSWRYLENRQLVTEVQAQATAIDEASDSLLPEHNQAIFALPYLDAARHLPGGYADRDDRPILSSMGLYPTEVSEAASDAYLRLLANALLPRVQMEIEEKLKRGGDSPDFLFEALKVYLMLEDEEHFDPVAVNAWVRYNWNDILPREVTADERANLVDHLEALLANMPVTLPIALDSELIERTRRAVMRIPLSDRVYGRLKRSPEATELEPFTLIGAGGRDTSAVLRRKSNLPLTEGIPGLFTYDGYHEVFDPLSTTIADRIAEESWILGEAGAIEQERMLARAMGSSSEREKLDEEVMDAYLTEFARHYEDLLADITLAPINSRSDAAQALRLLSDEKRSPLLRILSTVARETDLTRVDEPEVDETDEKAGAVKEQMDRLNALVGNRVRAPTIVRNLGYRQQRLERFKDRAFGELQGMMTPDQSGSSPFDSVMVLLDRLYVFLDELQGASDTEVVQRSQEMTALVGDLRREGERAPPIVKNLLTEVTGNVTATVTGDIYSFLDNMWKSEGLNFCRQAIAGRYPIERRAPRGEIRLGDFADFFGPGGHMDRFFTDHLAEHVDMSRTTWRWRPSSGMSGQASANSLRQFQRARTIRETFFRAGSGPAVRFDIKPVSMDADITRFVLTLAGQKVEYSHGPSVWLPMQWPGPDATEVRVEMMPPSGQDPRPETGDWAWFKMLDKSSMAPATLPEHFNVTFSGGSRTATWQLRASSAYNPFRADVLSQFSCPGRL